jgi:carbonic anhydrase
MRLFEAILEANHRAAAGDASAGLRPAEFADALPVAALTCIDARLNPLLPEVLGIPEEHFIWLRNAGNIITGPVSSTMRSLALACAVKGAREIAVIGHTDCQVCKTTMMQLLERLRDLGVARHVLPDDVNEYFGLFASERQNVIKACDLIRHSPLIGPKIPVHGLLVDLQTGRLEWLVNGYLTFAAMSDRWNEVVRSAGETVDKLKALADFQIGEMKFPETKIGETVTQATDWLSQKIGALEIKPEEQSAPPPPPPAAASIAGQIVELAEQHWPRPPEPRPARPAAPPPPPKIPLPPPIRVKAKFPPRPKR